MAAKPGKSHPPVIPAIGHIGIELQCMIICINGFREVFHVEESNTPVVPGVFVIGIPG